MVVGQSIGMLVGYVAYFAVLFGGERNVGSWIMALPTRTRAAPSAPASRWPVRSKKSLAVRRGGNQPSTTA